MRSRTAANAPANRATGEPRPDRRGLLAAGFVLLVLITGTNVPSPLYGLYEEKFGFSALTVTFVVAVYAAAVVPSLLLTGPLADAAGYRRVVIPAGVLALAGTLLFAGARGTGWLFAARAVQGIAVGTATPALTAALIAAEPRRHERAALLASAMTTGGAGLGPLMAGTLAAFAPLPLRLPFLAEAALLVLALPAARLLPGGPARARWRPRVPRVPRGTRRSFAVAAAVSFLAWAVAYTMLALAPSYVAARLHTASPLAGGATAGLLMICAAVVQFPSVSWPARRAEVVGLAGLAAGLASVIVAARAGSLWLLLAGMCVAGAGQGLAVMGATRHATRAVPARQRAGVAAAFWIASYLGGGLPVIGAGFLSAGIGLVPAVDIFAVVIGIASLLTLIPVYALLPRTEIT